MSDLNQATVGIDVVPDGIDWLASMSFHDHIEVDGLGIVMLPVTNACSENEAAWNTTIWIRENILYLARLHARLIRSKQLRTHVLNMTTGRIERRLP